MKRHVATLLAEGFEAAVAAGRLPSVAAVEVRVEEPADPDWGDLTSDLPLVLGRRLRRPPEEIGHVVLAHVRDSRGWVASAEVGGPGFLNVRLTPAFWRDLLAESLLRETTEGCLTPTQRRRAEVRLEVRSGPSRDGRSARAAAVAAALVRLRAAAGWGVNLSGDPDLLVRLGVRSDPTPGMPAEERITITDGHPVGSDAAVVVEVGAVAFERAGLPESVTVDEVIDALGRGVVRWALLGRPATTPITVDLDVAGEEGMENPFFAVRYADARIARLIRGAPSPLGSGPLILGAEGERVVRTLVGWPDVVAEASARIAPDRIVRFAGELAAAFHRYYNRVAISTDDQTLACSRTAVAQGVQLVLHAALRIAGVEASDGI